MKNWKVNILTVKLLSVAANEFSFSEYNDMHRQTKCLIFRFLRKTSKLVLLHMNELKYNGLLIIATGCAVVAGTKTTGALKLSVYASELQLITPKPPPTPSASPMISPHFDQHHSLRAPKASLSCQ